MSRRRCSCRVVFHQHEFFSWVEAGTPRSEQGVDLLMSRNQRDIPITLQPRLPRRFRIQIVRRLREARRDEFELSLTHFLWTRLHHDLLHNPRLDDPLAHIVLLVPPHRPHRPLVRRDIQVRLVAKFPVRQLPTGGQSFAGELRGLDQGRVAERGVGGEVEAVGEGDIGPGGVGVEVGGADGDGGWVVRGAGWVDGADDGGGLGGVEEGVVLSIAADAYDRVRPL